MVCAADDFGIVLQECYACALGIIGLRRADLAKCAECAICRIVESRINKLDVLRRALKLLPLVNEANREPNSETYNYRRLRWGFLNSTDGCNAGVNFGRPLITVDRGDTSEVSSGRVPRLNSQNLATRSRSRWHLDNEPPGSDGNSGNVATSGKVAMAKDGDSEPVTRAMIAAGISQLPPMNMSLAEVSELLRFGVRARLRRSSRPDGLRAATPRISRAGLSRCMPAMPGPPSIRPQSGSRPMAGDVGRPATA
jgi:hypothetical protein